MTNFERTTLTPEQFTDLVLPIHTDYQPAPDVIEHTHRVDLTTVTGPAGVGKDTVIRLTGLPQIISDTTRPPRINDGEPERHGVHYFFRGDELATVYVDVNKGRYVQWAPNPHNNSFYGSRNEAYPADGPALIDVMAAAIQPMREIRGYFRSLESAYMVAEDYATWRTRLNGRGVLSSADLEGRLKEALSSLEQGLDDTEMRFVLNRDKHEAAKNLTLIAERRLEPGSIDEEYARSCGSLMLHGLKDELGLGRPL